MQRKIVVIIALLTLYSSVSSNTVRAPPPVTASDRAAIFLKSHQYSNGTYGAYLEHWAASAAYGLYLYEGNSTNVTTALLTLESAMDNKSWWFWDPIFGEADIPGLTLYVINQTQHLSSLNLTQIVPLLSTFRNTTAGGYHGFYGVPYDSVNTLYALQGLIGAEAISQANLTQSFSYLLSLQVQNGPMRGSFNMTQTVSNSTFQSLAPDPISQTAAILLTFSFSGTNPSNSSVNLALNFLRMESVQNSSHTTYNGQVFAAAISALAFKTYGDMAYANNARSFLVTNQNTDGGFSDRSRFSYPSSNALDTAWALIALQTVPSSTSSTSLPQGLNLTLTLLGVLLLTVRRRDHLNGAPSSSHRLE